MSPQRHHLIYLKPHADLFIASIHPDKYTIEHEVVAWIAKGLPCIYARQSANKERVNLGIPLLMGHTRYRIALQVSPAAVRELKPLPQLAVMRHFFQHYHGIEELDVLLASHQVSHIAVYGSFLFHYLSGQSYVNDTSDLDLLITYQDYSLAQLHDLRGQLTQKFKRSIDGEVRFQRFGDVPINELLDTSAKKLLCKGKEQSVLLSRAELNEHYPML